MHCPLCQSSNTHLFESVHNDDYFRCIQCHLIFLDFAKRPTLEQEKDKYDQHQNSPQHEGYRKFLQPVVHLVEQLKTSGSKGLDYGSGPGPTLSVMLEEKGYSVENYDPIYNDDQALLEMSYDFITCTEAIEHFFDPLTEIHKLQGMIAQHGVLVFMTHFFDDPSQFRGSHYHRDPTHVCFYSTNTFLWIANKLKFHIQFAPPNKVVLKNRQFK